jgi:hypothetical protein
MAVSRGQPLETVGRKMVRGAPWLELIRGR